MHFCVANNTKYIWCILCIVLSVFFDVGASDSVDASTVTELTDEQKSFLSKIKDRIENDLPVPVYCVRDTITPESTEFIQKILALDDTLIRFNGTDFNRWKTTATDGSGIVLGQPITLTWSIVPDGVNVNGAGKPSNLLAKFDTAFGSRAAWVDLIQEVFDQWEAKTGITYLKVSDDGAAFPASDGAVGVRGDIRIGGTNIDGAGKGVIAFNYFPGSGGDMVIDTANTDDTFKLADNNYRLLKNTVSHEHGHGMGFGHVCPLDGSKIMEPRLAENFDHSGLDDIANANRKYGDAYEINGRNDSVATAANLGAVVTQTLGNASDPLRQITGLDSALDNDFFAVDFIVGDSISFVLRPRGTSFPFADDNGKLCGGVATSFYASGLVIDLGIQFLDVDGTTILGQADLNGVGADEFIPKIIIPATGTYFIRVYTNDAPLIADDDQVQLYALDIETPGLDSLPIPAVNPLSNLVVSFMLMMLGIRSLSTVSKKRL